MSLHVTQQQIPVTYIARLHCLSVHTNRLTEMHLDTSAELYDADSVTLWRFSRTENLFDGFVHAG